MVTAEVNWPPEMSAPVQLYCVPPVAVKIIASPLEMDKPLLLLMVITGNGFTVTVALPVWFCVAKASATLINV